MNKFNEFDNIKTPDDWKTINFKQASLKNHYPIASHFVMIGICLVLIFSSFGIVYAYNEEFRSWLQEQFQGEKIEYIPQMQENKMWELDGKFLVYYHEKNNLKIVDEVYVFIDGKFVKKEVMHKQGKYKLQNYSFDYVRCQDQIFTFNEKGFFAYSLHLMKDELIYFGSTDNNLCSLNMKTGEVLEITSDQDSVNFAISPNRKYILINKNDKYWTVYDTDKHTEKKINEMNPYAHNEEYDFFGEHNLITYDDGEETVIINLETLEAKSLNETCLYPAPSSFTVDFYDQQTTLHNHIDGKKIKINENLENYRYSIFQNRYIIFDSFLDKKIVFVDFKEQKYKVLEYFGKEEYLEYFIVDNQYLIINNTQDYYIMSFQNIFS